MDANADREMDEDDEEDSAWVSGSNLYAESNLPHPGELHARSQLIRQLFALFRERKLSVLQVAEELGISEAAAADLVHGRLNEFSISQLFDYLDTLGYDAEIKIQPRAPGKRISLRRKAKARR